MNYKLLSLVASCVLVILNAVPIRGVATPQLPLEVHAPEFAAILGERPKLDARGDRIWIYGRPGLLQRERR
mgnify:CR=1 FL=1